VDKFDQFYMNVAGDAAKLSYARRLKVGAVVVKDRNILAFSYNGTLPGVDNNCEDDDNGVLVTKDSVLHSEENAIIKMARSNSSAVGATMYVTHQPCMKCARMIAASGFTRLVYQHCYRDSGGVELLQQYGVVVEQIGHIMDVDT
jgi:dCMP deaminase